VGNFEVPIRLNYLETPGLNNVRQLGDISKSEIMAFNMAMLVNTPKDCIGLKPEKEKTINPKAAEREVNKAVLPTPCSVRHTAFE